MSARAPQYAVLATLDTKREEAEFLAAQLRRTGGDVCLVDLTVARPSSSDDEPTLGALAGDVKQAAMRAAAERAKAVLGRMVADGALDAAVGLGGGQGTWLVAEVMKELPLEMPKALVTTLATRAGTYLGTADVTVLPSITDIAGLNPILRGVLVRAASALAGMASAPTDESRNQLTAITMFGVTSAGGALLRNRLEANGIETAVFHANGSGGTMMERLIREGRIAGVLDWTTTELADELCGGIATAGPDRLRAAGRAGIPQLVIPGALDIVNFGPRETVPNRYSTRRLHSHTPAATLMRTDDKDARRLGLELAERLNNATGPVAVLVPGRGFSELSRPGGVFHDPEADEAFITALKAHLDPGIPVDVVDHDINAPDFADAAADRYLALISD